MSHNLKDLVFLNAQPMSFATTERLVRACALTPELAERVSRKIAGVVSYFEHAIRRCDQSHVSYTIIPRAEHGCNGTAVLRIWSQQIDSQQLHGNLLLAIDAGGAITDLQNVTVHDAVY